VAGDALRASALLGYKSCEIPKLTWFWKKPQKRWFTADPPLKSQRIVAGENLSLSLQNG